MLFTTTATSPLLTAQQHTVNDSTLHPSLNKPTSTFPLILHHFHAFTHSKIQENQEMVESLLKWVFFMLLCSNLLLISNAQLLNKRVYVIQMDKSAMPDSFSDHLEWYANTVESALVDQTLVAGDGNARILYNYQTAFHGVAAHLTQAEAETLEKRHGVVSVFPEIVYHLHTTRSAAFLGLEPADSTSIWSEKVPNHDVIVGVLDTGIWPESQSFNDSGLTPVPRHWKGICETGRGFTKLNCNKKIVGARVFYKGYEAATGKINDKDEYRSPRDQDGHGSHTAATVAGTPVRGANLLGYGSGTARGMAPGARVAAYKVCWSGGCFSSDILSAVDTAVADGVNVLSISLGGGAAYYFRDPISIASFGAMEMGVFVSCSAGNGGPDPVSLTNVSPWVTTVGASTMDRDFPATARLGNGRVVTGVSLYKGRRNLSRRMQYPLVYAGGNSSSPDPKSLCMEGTLDPNMAAGKIVICDRGVNPRVEKGQVVKNAGGLGMILVNTAANGEELVADCHLLPTVAVGETAGKSIIQYALASRKPTATLAFLGTKLGIKPSPVVAAFSSRGPNSISLEVLKPDMVAPGVNILAAWTGILGPSTLATDRRKVGFNILSGTSMSCPHVSGVAALLKARHPEWSPAAIKSALMTTAYVHDNTRIALKDASTGGSSTPYDHGAGHINPLKAIDPGLIYDINAKDYFDFLCAQKLNPGQLKVFSKTSNWSCKNTSFTNAADLNYPALSVIFPMRSSRSSTVTLQRTVTNVGAPVSNYHVRVSPLKGVTVKVVPPVLKFSSKNQKLSYKVTFTTVGRQLEPVFGGLAWINGVHKVRSPITLTWSPPPIM